jgi:hypothetical protein
MRRLLFLITSLLLFIPLISRGAEGDWGYAHIFYIKKAFTEKWSFITGSQLTWRDDMSDLYFIYADAGAGYRFHPNWSAEAVYRQGWWKFPDEWNVERRPLVNLKWFCTWKGIRLQNQARLEFRFFEWDRKDDLRFRNRTRIEFPWEVLPGGIKPFAEEELFIGKNSEQLETNWVTAGLYGKLTKTVKLKAGYRWIRIRAGGSWENRNQLVTGVAWIF